MLRWLIGGGREPQGLAETIGEEQTQNPYTELLVLKAHHDIVRFLVQLDDYRFASAGDDGIVVVWNAQCLAVLRRLDVWLSGGNDLCMWNRKLDLLCKTSHLSDTGISALIEIPKNCVVAAVGKELTMNGSTKGKFSFGSPSDTEPCS
ncbi:hypothetical protein CB1_000917017 [Camelus ferus]|nr:hypothetical protein CB1_000917017 [Camelus ferus]